MMFYAIYSDIMPDMNDLRAQFEGFADTLDEAEVKASEIESSGLYAFIREVWC